jgi:HTH-type transcriptional regulator/antitoxin HigA
MMATLSAYDELLLKIKPQPIRSKSQYRRVLAQLDELMEPHPGREASLMVELLAALVQQYEATRCPAPRPLPPSDLLAELIEARQVTAADVSRAAGVPRSVLSNVLAGRRSVSKASALKLAEFFRVPVTAFLETPKASSGPAR